jgi:excisionase family DNA binding protein
MKPSRHNDDLQWLREQLRQRIDVAAKSVADVLHAATDLFLASLHSKPSAGTSDKAETNRVPEIMTPQQAADYLGVSTGTLSVWRCRRSYPLPFVKVGSKVCYRKSDLVTFIEHRTRGGGES